MEIWLLDVPSIIAGADTVYEYPMIDREPVNCWRDGSAILIVMQHMRHIQLAQVVHPKRFWMPHLGAAIMEQGPGATSAQIFEDQVLQMANRVTLANRGNGGPDAIMQMAEDRCEGDFSQLNRLLPYAEREAHAAAFKVLAGLTAEGINERPSIVQPSETA